MSNYIETEQVSFQDFRKQVLDDYRLGRISREASYLTRKEVLTGKVVQVVEGGLSVVVEDARVFIPASLVSDTFERDLSKYKDTEIEFVITEFNPLGPRLHSLF